MARVCALLSSRVSRFLGFVLSTGIPTPLDRHNDDSSTVPKKRMLLPRTSESKLRHTILNAMNTLHPDTKIAYSSGGLTWTVKPGKDPLEPALDSKAVTQGSDT